MDTKDLLWFAVVMAFILLGQWLDQSMLECVK